MPEGDLFKKHGWSVILDERDGSIRIIGSIQRKRVIVRPRDGNSITVLQIDRELVDPATPKTYPAVRRKG